MNPKNLSRHPQNGSNTCGKWFKTQKSSDTQLKEGNENVQLAKIPDINNIKSTL
jgi:hypothetical protein